MPNSKGPGRGRVQHVFLGGIIIIIMIKHVNYMAPQGRQAFHLDERKKTKKKEKKEEERSYCATENHGTCLGR